MAELKCQIISQKVVSIFSCLTDLPACVRVNKKMAQPFGLSLRQNKEQIIHFQIGSPAPVYRCSFVISSITPLGNNDQCTVWWPALLKYWRFKQEKSHVENKPSNSKDTRHTSKFLCVFNLLEIRDSPTETFPWNWYLNSFEFWASLLVWVKLVEIYAEVSD